MFSDLRHLANEANHVAYIAKLHAAIKESGIERKIFVANLKTEYFSLT